MDIRPVAPSPQPAQAAPDKAAAPVPLVPVAGAVEPAARVQQPAAVPDTTQLAHALKNINRMLQEAMPPQNLEFSIDEESNRTVVKVVDQTSGEVLRQIPTEEALELAKALELSPGLLIRQQA